MLLSSLVWLWGWVTVRVRVGVKVWIGPQGLRVTVVSC